MRAAALYTRDMAKSICGIEYHGGKEKGEIMSERRRCCYEQ